VEENTMARTALTVRTGFLSDAQLDDLTGTLLVHQLADGTRVTVSATGERRDGYATATVVAGEHQGRTVRLDQRTALATVDQVHALLVDATATVHGPGSTALERDAANARISALELGIVVRGLGIDYMTIADTAAAAARAASPALIAR
jgi:mRNA-degrading endonuclease toxin of MazEF toxin-antitoxin module